MNDETNVRMELDAYNFFHQVRRVRTRSSGTFFEVPEEKSVQGYLIQRRACFEKYSSSGTMHVCEKHLGFWSYITLQKRLYRNEDLPPYSADILNLLRLLRFIIDGDLRDTMIIPSSVQEMLSMRSPSTFQDYVCTLRNVTIYSNFHYRRLRV